MSRLLLMLVFSATVFFISCSKDKTPVKPELSEEKFELLQKHAWQLDSQNIITTTANVMAIETGEWIQTFYGDSMILVYHGIPIYYGLSYEAPDKIYFWLRNDQKEDGLYFIIDKIDEQKLVLRGVDESAQDTRIHYMHAK